MSRKILSLLKRVIAGSGASMFTLSTRSVNLSSMYFFKASTPRSRNVQMFSIISSWKIRPDRSFRHCWFSWSNKFSERKAFTNTIRSAWSKAWRSGWHSTWESIELLDVSNSQISCIVELASARKAKELTHRSIVSSSNRPSIPPQLLPNLLIVHSIVWSSAMSEAESWFYFDWISHWKTYTKKVCLFDWRQNLVKASRSNKVLLVLNRPCVGHIVLRNFDDSYWRTEVQFWPMRHFVQESFLCEWPCTIPSGVPAKKM